MKTSGSREFDALRDQMEADPVLRREIEWALDLSLDRYSPTMRANRFMIGGLAEWIVAAACYQARVLTLPEGHDADGTDLMDLRSQLRGMWSMKTSYSRTISDFIISNGRGGAGRGFVDPTVFASPQLPGLVFVDPDLHPEVGAQANPQGGETTLPVRVVVDFAKRHPECVAELTMPVNTHRPQVDPAVSTLRGLIAGPQFSRLPALFNQATPATTSVSVEIERLARQKRDGLITDAQFEAAVARVTGQT